jgi:hypothetical protein
LGALFAYFLPESYWEKRDLPTLVAATILTLNGIMLALSWSAFAKIYETIGASGFSLFLREKGLLNSYLFFIRYVHLFQMVALIASAIGLVILQIIDIPIIYQRMAVALVVGATAYAIKQAAGSVTVMRDVVRHRATFDAERQGKVHRVS